MTADAALGKKIAFGFTSVLAWLVLFVAFLATALTLTANDVGHAGDTASAIVQHLSKNPATIDSLLSEFEKSADSKTVAQIDKNRAVINSTIAALGDDKVFQNSLASTLNKISQAIMDGSISVTVDLGPLAAAIADKVNAASQTPVISKNQLAKLKPQVLDLSKGSVNISEARTKIKDVTLAWLLWLVFLGVLYLLMQWKVLRTAGWQLLSIGFMFLVAVFAAPVVVRSALNNSTAAEYQKALVPEVLKSLTGPMKILSIIVAVLGLVIVIADQFRRNRLRLRTVQISPSVVA